MQKKSRKGEAHAEPFASRLLLRKLGGSLDPHNSGKARRPATEGPAMSAIHSLSKQFLRGMTLALALVMAAQASAQSVGCLHMPSTFSQYLGYGYGAGRHAPIVHAPLSTPMRMPRRTHAPGYCDPVGYAPIGCSDGGCGAATGGYGMPTMPMPTPGPELAPPAASAPSRMMPGRQNGPPPQVSVSGGRQAWRQAAR